MPDFECRLKKYRQMKDMTQEQLAVLVGVRRETIMRLEKAQYNPSLKLAIDISRAVEAKHSCAALRRTTTHESRLLRTSCSCFQRISCDKRVQAL